MCNSLNIRRQRELNREKIYARRKAEVQQKKETEMVRVDVLVSEERSGIIFF
jgi:hypothetical protein